MRLHLKLVALLRFAMRADTRFLFGRCGNSMKDMGWRFAYYRGPTMKNEATFESQLGAVLGKWFPASGVQVTHQVQFTVRLGHHDIRADGRKGWLKKGRADVLLTSKAGHVALLELKREGLDLTDDDRDQGISYARLLTPMPPLVVVSNGATTNFYKTIDGTPWSQECVSDHVFLSLVSEAVAVAAADRDEAIRSILGANSGVWAEFLRRESAATLAARTGELKDFSRPFARDFCVARELVPRVLGKLRTGAAAMAVVGPPLSGKSVVLKQCCEKLATGELVPLYVDASSAHQGPLRLLASMFLRNVFAATSLDGVRQWLSTSLRTLRDETRVVLFLDEIVPQLNETWLGDLDELIALADGAALSIVTALDPNTWKALSSRPGRRTKTEFGLRTEPVHLELLSDREFNLALEQLFEATRSQPYFGGQYNIEYREPRVLRVIAGRVPAPRRVSKGTCLKFPSTTTLAEVNMIWDFLVRSEHDLVAGLRQLSRAYLDYVGAGTSDPELQLASHRAAAIRHDVAVNSMPRETLDWLVKHSFVTSRLGPNEEVLLLPRHIEFFAKAASLELGELVSTIESSEEAYRVLMERSDMFPLGDIVGAGALRVAAQRVPKHFTHIFYQALSDTPSKHTVPAGVSVEVSFRGRVLGEVELPEPSSMVGNLHPWLVLAQLAVIPMVGPEERASPNGRILATVGAYDGLLRRVEDELLPGMVGFHFHEIAGKGSVLCRNNGVVEPVGNAMISGFYTRPEEMIGMSEYAVAEDVFQLAWRLQSAAREVTTTTDTSVAEAADEVVALTDEYLRGNYATILDEVASEGPA